MHIEYLPKKIDALSATADQCYAYNKFCREKKSLQRHLKSCGHMPRIKYKFENQNIQTISIYFGFETTCGKKVYNFNKDATLYPVSYAFVVAFHPSLNLDRSFEVRSFNHNFDQLNDIGYLLDEMLPYHDFITVWQMRDCAKPVHEKRGEFLHIFDADELKLSKSIQNPKNTTRPFWRMLQIFLLLNTNYLNESDIEDISNDCMIEFVNGMNFDRLPISTSKLKIFR